MRIQVVSDLHLEFRASRDRIGLRPSYIQSLKQPDVDVLVLAGDIMNWRDEGEIRAAAKEFSLLARNVVWVPGNHEYYGTSAPSAHQAVVRAFSDVPANIFPVIRPTAITIDNQKFVLGTMWYNQKAVERSGYDPEYGLFPNGENTYLFSDYRWIVGLYPWVFQQDLAFHELLRAELDSNSVVVTHHLPSPQSTPKQFQNQPSNCFFINDKRPLINKREPKLWIHGHTHTRCDYLSGVNQKSRIVANPCGYETERKDFFAYPPMIIEA